MKTLDIVLPVYNEEACLDKTIERLVAVKNGLGGDYKVNFIFIDDGSEDKSLEILKNYAEKFPFIKIISFTRNFGHQSAIWAGIENSSADFIVLIDADLQDPPEIIKEMVNKAESENAQIVYGKRLKRRKENPFKKITAFLYYRIFKYLCRIDMPLDTGDFRLITQSVAQALRTMPERNKFLRGMIAWTGFKSVPIEYEREERYAGKTKYSLSKMFKLAFDGIFAFSDRPVKFINLASLTLLLCAVILTLYGRHLGFMFFFFGVTGLVLFCCAIQLFAIGIIGEYLIRTFDNSKERPVYIINSKVNF